MTQSTSTSTAWIRRVADLLRTRIDAHRQSLDIRAVTR
jgi:hypothetical protein